VIDQEQAKKLKVGDIVHNCPSEGLKCEEWEVTEPYAEYWEGWLVGLCIGKDAFAAICEKSKGEWHLPGECPPCADSRSGRIPKGVENLYQRLVICPYCKLAMSYWKREHYLTYWLYFWSCPTCGRVRITKEAS